MRIRQMIDAVVVEEDLEGCLGEIVEIVVADAEMEIDLVVIDLVVIDLWRWDYPE